MSEDKQEAKKLADRAGTQAKHAAKNSGRAVRVVTEPVVEDVAEGVEAVAEETVSFARKLGYAAPELAATIAAFALTIYSGKHALAAFRGAPAR